MAFNETETFVAGRTNLAVGSIRLRILLSYLGTRFHGISPQRGYPTVGETLLDALCISTQATLRPTLVVSGRTDTGVHAWGQVVHVDIAKPIRRLDTWRLRRSLNTQLPADIVVREIAVVDESFDARFGATYRQYRYTIVNRPVADPFLTETAWHVPRTLNFLAMQLAADPFIGHQDYSSFCRIVGEKPDASLVRRVSHARWIELPDQILRFDIQANAFCQQMVRSIVGFLVEVGLGKRTAGDVLRVLRARDRRYAPNIAPAHGLCLWEVGYP